MDAKRAYEREFLSGLARLAGRRQPGLSDEERDGEWRAQRIFYDALAPFRSRVQDAICLTGLRADLLQDLLAELDEATPDRRAWDEAILEARHAD